MSWAGGSSPQPDLVLATFHWIEYVGLLGGIGSFVVRRVGRMTPRVAWADPPMHIAFTWAFLGGASLLVLTPSWAVAVRVAAEGVALFLCLRGKRFVAPFAVLAAVVLPFAGHAARLELQPIGAEFVDALHVLSAGMWAGGILALASLQPPSGWRSTEASVMLERFGRVAIIAFGVTALTGVLRATEQLNELSDLWSTAYGIVLTLKVAGVASMVGVSGLWRLSRVSAGWEAGATALVVGATALLAAFPPPA